MSSKYLKGLVNVAKTPGISEKWEELRILVRSNHPTLWGKLRGTRHFVNDRHEDWKYYGFQAIQRDLKRVTSEMIPSSSKKKSSILWLDLGYFGELLKYDGGETFQDHGLGLLRTILHQEGIETDLVSIRNHRSWDELAKHLKGYKILLMNVRSYRYDIAVTAAQLFHQLNPDGIVMVGGMHTSVDSQSMESIKEFDKICIGAGEKVITDLVRNPDSFPRVFQGKAAATMEDWPLIDRTLWPKPAGWARRFNFTWPLEEGQRWGPRPVASVLTSRVCPWQCSFCNERSYIPNMRRRTVDSVINELNALDDKYQVGSVVIHDSMFFQKKSWLEEWLEKYPQKANKLWSYWAASRADTVCEWPELFEALIRETNWNVVSIGFESGSDPMLRMLNKQSTEEENEFVIQLVNRIGDEMEQEGKTPVSFWSNIMLALPGETHEDAFKTIRMIKRMKRAAIAMAFFTPFPGSALGNQLIAENKSLVNEQFVRDQNVGKILGIDYDFYHNLLQGKYDDEVNQGLSSEEQERDVYQFFSNDAME